MGDDEHKDLVYYCTKDTIKENISYARKIAKQSGSNINALTFLIKELGLDLSFDTIDNVFSIEDSSRQPLIYTPNLNNVIETARKEGRDIDIMAGLCTVPQARVFITNKESYIHLPPFRFKELDPDAKLRLEDLLALSVKLRNGEPFPGGVPNIGKLNDYHHVTPSYVPLEPSFGKAMKILNYFEIARAINTKLKVIIPTNEYLEDTLPLLTKTPFNVELVEKDIRLASRIFREYTLNLQKNFYPNQQVSFVDTDEETVKRDLKKVIADENLLQTLEKLGDNAYGRMHLGEQMGGHMDRIYTALFLSLNGELLTDKDSPSRIIFIHARDLVSFALQSIWIYDQMVKDKPYSWEDRIAVVGVSGGPAYRLPNDNERIKYQTLGHRLPDDDYLAFGEHCFFLGDSPEVIKQKINQMHPTKKSNDPMYAYIRKLHHFVDPNNTDVRRYIDAYPSMNKETRFELGKEVLSNLMISLKQKAWK